MMKSVILSLLALVAGVSASPLPDDIVNNPPNADLQAQKDAADFINGYTSGKLGQIFGGPMATRQLAWLARSTFEAKDGQAGTIGLFVKNFVNYGYGLVERGENDAARRVEMSPRNNLKGSKTVKIRYGPYLVPSMMTKNMVGEEGSLFNYPDIEWERPCEGKCTIVGVQAGLEYPDGSNANIDTGMWLHHMVLFNGGPGRADATCKGLDVSLPHIIVNETSKTSERFLASGNERTPFYFPTELKVGYKLNPEDKFSAIVDLMNENMVDKKVYLTMIYDYADGHPEDYDTVKPVWLDVQECGTSEVVSPHKENVFSLGSDWVSDFDGEILGAGGHLHDGGSHLTLSMDGKQLCDSKASYGQSPQFVAPSTSHSAHGGIEHISSMSPCIGFVDFKNVPLQSGQKWRLEAHYDYNQHKPSMHGDEGFDSIMGIALMYVRQKK